jgi:hypothetical protein
MRERNSEWDILDKINAANQGKESKALKLFYQLVRLIEQKPAGMTPDIEKLLHNLDMEDLADRLFGPLVDLSIEIAADMQRDFSEETIMMAKEFLQEVYQLLQSFQILDFVQLAGRRLEKRPQVKKMEEGLSLVSYWVEVYLRIDLHIKEFQMKLRATLRDSKMN